MSMLYNQVVTYSTWFPSDVSECTSWQPSCIAHTPTYLSLWHMYGDSSRFRNIEAI